jgi:cell division protein FtsQ
LSATSTSRRPDRSGAKPAPRRRGGRHEAPPDARRPKAAASKPKPKAKPKPKPSQQQQQKKAKPTASKPPAPKQQVLTAPRARRRRRRIAIVVPAAAAALALGAWWATHSSIFDAKHVSVSGASHLTRADVLEAAGVGPGTNLLWADTSAIESAVESDPWVAEATVTRSLPSTIRIAVTERRPASTVVVGSTWFLVAADGTVLAPARHRPDLPVLPTAQSLTVGSRPAALATAAEVAGGMSPWLRSRVVTVDPGEGGWVQLGLDDGVRVLFGPPTDVVAKAQALAGILQWAADRHRRLSTIDVRSPVSPAAVAFDSVVPDPAPGAGLGG